jgi:FMN phosphatase YigB (HAD superfamily)
MLKARGPVFLLDVDNTLLDNDRFAADLGDHLERTFGAAQRERYWQIFDQLRADLGRADYLEALQRFRVGLEHRPELLGVAEFMLEYPFASRLYPGALQAIAHLRSLGVPAVLSDGDIVFQPHKIRRAGIWDAVDGAVMIHLHKERELADVERRFPVAHYVMVDDKPNLLGAVKAQLGPRVTTVFVRQGHYALAPGASAGEPPPDRVIEHIGALNDWRSSDF